MARISPHKKKEKISLGQKSSGENIGAQNTLREFCAPMKRGEKGRQIPHFKD
jgi:hypothetical protein